MPVPTTAIEFLDLVHQSGVLASGRLQHFLDALPSETPLPNEPKELARRLVGAGLLTYFQADQLLKGKWRGFLIHKYRVLERLGSGGMGIVYLAEHQFLGHRVALKVLQADLAKDRWFRDSFDREARAGAELNHPNLVRTLAVDHDGQWHFLVMEYIDGSSLQQIVDKHGPLSIERVAHYLKQVAMGLQYVHGIRRLVHRDIKPGNLLLDRQGVVKVLDMGLACIRREADKKVVRHCERRIVGTDDYLAPEQIVDSDDVDARADLYSLGATGYFLLTGRTPFQDLTHANHKLIWHVTQRPKPLRDFRRDTPTGLVSVIERMMDKNPWGRYRTAADVIVALEPWTREPIAPPSPEEMPRLSPAVRDPNSGAGLSFSGDPSHVGGRSSILGSSAVSNSLLASPGVQTPSLRQPNLDTVPDPLKRENER